MYVCMYLTYVQQWCWVRCIRATAEELENFGTPDFTIYNAGQFPCNRYTHYMTSSTSIDINLARREMVILGTQYAGEMKKGLFGVMHYLMPKRQILSLHSGCNMGKDGDVALFFGLSGTGKTTLSTDHNRYLIGDDEHCWSETGVSNIEGGCYAKCIDLSKDKEPDIWNAIKFGTVLENVVFDEHSRQVDYADKSVTGTYIIHHTQTSRHNSILFFMMMIMQRILALHIPLSTFPMQKSLVWGLIQKMSSSWLAMHLVCYLQSAN